MVRVMLLATDLERGGLPLRLVRMAPRLRNLGIAPVVGSLAPRGPLADDLEAQGVETFSCDAAGRFDAFCLRRFAGHVRQTAPDIVHAFLFHANLAARLIGRMDRPRPIITTTVTIEIERRWHLWLETLTSGLSDLHVANSEAVADHLRTDLGFRNDQVVVIPNAIDVDAIKKAPRADRAQLGIGDDTMLVAWAGRMDPVKNLAALVQVIDEVSRQRRVAAVLLGDGSERRRIEALVEQNGLRHVIRFMGWTQDVVGWLKAADALLFPSLTEGSSNVVLEAIACGCPVVAADLPSCRELITSPELGRLCAPRRPGAFASCLVDLPVRRAESPKAEGDAKRRVLNCHSMDRIVRDWAALYDCAIGGSHN